MAGPGIKIEDGLFVGDRDASCDLHSAKDAHVSRVVNCCGQQLYNRWDDKGVQYLTYKWKDADSQIILDEQDKAANEVFKFVEEGLEAGEGVLIHSFHGQSRSCCILTAYLMRRYQWTKSKTLQYLEFRGVPVDMKPAFQQQLLSYEARLAAKSGSALSNAWSSPPSGEQLNDVIVTNTYLNGQVSGALKHPAVGVGAGLGTARTSRLQWSDSLSGAKVLLECQEPEQPLRTHVPGRSLPVCAAKSILRGAGRSEKQIMIRTKAGEVQCKPDEIVPQRLGLKVACKTIILEYIVPKLGLRALHNVAVDAASFGFGDATDVKLAEHLRTLHAPWLAGVSISQLTELLGRMHS
eukprot:TRINITY_DN57592_c0_g1_i1.p1 TRINITY_DN57592_c0_g1~~TRINITY_DN57592_c0_g1_i1.p1  ORF type:complete len:351 (+),score=54.50 TRINITY_DN57592_c0_g1_i1:46-1098(+)